MTGAQLLPADLYRQALLAVYDGRLVEALNTCLRSIQAGQEGQLGHQALAAAIMAEQGDIATAGEEVRKGLALWNERVAGEDSASADLLALYSAQARIWRLSGDWEEALATTEKVAEAYDPSLGQGLRAYILSQRGDTSWLEEESARSLGATPPVFEEDTSLNPWSVPWHLWGAVWVRVAVARARRLRLSRDSRAAAALLQPVMVYLMKRMASSERSSLTHRLIELSILQSLAMDAMGDRLRALVAVERSVSLAQAGRYASVFHEEGESMQYLLEAFRAEAARKSGTSSRRRAPVVRSDQSELLAYVDRLLSDFPGQTRSRRDVKMRQPAQQPAVPRAVGRKNRSAHEMEATLTPREAIILTMLSQENSYQEIADRLFVSMATVRWHVRSLYRKLGVSSRARAVARGKEMNLL